MEDNGSNTFITKLFAPDKGVSDEFGKSVSLSGSIVAVGVPGDDPNGTLNAGSVYLFKLEDNGSSTFLSKVTAPDKAANDYFGLSITQSGNVLAVGANASDQDGISNSCLLYTSPSPRD